MIELVQSSLPYGRSKIINVMAIEIDQMTKLIGFKSGRSLHRKNRQFARTVRFSISDRSESLQSTKIFLQAEKSLSDICSKNFLSTMASEKFYVYPENLSPQVKRGQQVIWSENNPSHEPSILSAQFNFKIYRLKS